MATLVILMLGWTVETRAAQSDINVPLPCEATHSLDRDTRLPIESECERRRKVASNVAKAQITNGEVAPDEQHTAAIFFVGADGKEYICTGILIDPIHLLTAGHCGCGRPDSYQISFEQNPMSGSTVKNAVKIDGKPILFDPLVCLLGPRPGKDLALIKLAAKVEQITDIFFGYPTPFASEEQLVAGKSLRVVGFGETETGSVAVRMKASIPILTPDCLVRPYDAFCAPFVEMILADQSSGPTRRDSCGGDSGGPVFARATVTLPQCIPTGTTRLSTETTAPSTGTIRTTKLVSVDQDIVVAITSRAAPFTQALAGKHCGGGGIYTLIGRRSVHAWFAANQVKPQGCVFEVK